MLRNTQSHPNKAKARQFVELFLGKGSASAKITTNMGTLNNTIRNKGFRANIHTHTLGCIVKLSGKKSLVWLRKPIDKWYLPEVSPKQKMELTLIHELTHAGINRLFSKKNKPQLRLVGEMIADLVELNYLKRISPSSHKEIVERVLKQGFSFKQCTETEVADKLAILFSSVFSEKENAEFIKKTISSEKISYSKFLVDVINQLTLSNHPIAIMALPKVKRI